MTEGQLFDGKYRILKVLGKGGMGTVYLAENVKLGTLWAIKSINKQANSKIDILVESNILKQLNHPSLPRIFDILEDESNIYVIVDYIDGTPLDKELQNVGKFPEETVVRWAKQICDVLIYLHTHKPNPIIYRDMKPSNIILTREGSIKLIDFGIAREYKAGSESDTIYIGTRGYAAPEQYGAGQTNAATDIFSLGITLYHILTGKGPNEPPYELKPVRTLDKSLSEGIEYIISKCTRQDPGERYQSAQELLSELANIEKVGKPEGSVYRANNSSVGVPEDYKKVVGIVGGPASGTTTIITALSEYFAENGKKVAIVDLTKNRRLYDMFGWGCSKIHPNQADYCNNSLKYLLEGKLKPLSIGKLRDLYISAAPVELRSRNYIDLIDRLKNDNDVVLIDMDYSTDIELVKYIDHLYIVKDMNMYSGKDTSEYIYRLKTAAINLSKLRVIINKYLECSVKPKTAVDTVTAYNTDSSDGQYEFLIKERPQFFVVPFELDNYRAAIDNVNSELFSCEGYTASFKEAICEIGNSLYPVKDKPSLKGYIKSFFGKK
ncbi:MAG: serine/threonine-protein kinase [Clostridia bacterium]|nr:serine/threonine-protein kinase [Clostridia bacterium]